LASIEFLLSLGKSTQFSVLCTYRSGGGIADDELLVLIDLGDNQDAFVPRLVA